MSKIKDLGNDLYSGNKSIDIVGRRKVFYLIGIAVVIASILIPVLKGGFNFGIEFRGGSEFRIEGVASSSQQLAIDAVQSVEPGSQPLVTTVGLDSVRIQTEQLDDTASEEVRIALASAYGVESGAVTSSFIGANWGADVTEKAFIALVVFLIVVSLLMALYFRTLKITLFPYTTLFRSRKSVV